MGASVGIGMLTDLRARASRVSCMLLLAFLVQLSLPALGLAGTMDAAAGGDIAVCSANGAYVLHLDEDGTAPVKAEALSGNCVFCLPLISAAVSPAEVPCLEPVGTDAIRLVPLIGVSAAAFTHPSSRPRAPPISL